MIATLLTSRTRLLTLAVAVLLAACGGDDTSDTAADVSADEQTEDGGTTDDATEEPAEEPAEDGPGFGAVAMGTVRLSGAVEETWTLGEDGITLIGAGGCSGDAFGMTIQVNNAAPQTIAQVSFEIDEDLGGGATGSFPLDDVELTLFDWSDGLTQTSYDGAGTFEVITHDAPAELNERRMTLTVTGTGLEGEEGSIDVTSDIDWVMGCPLP